MDSVPVTPQRGEDEGDPQLEVRGCSYYRMNHRRRGVAALFNNRYFNSSVSERKGSELDMSSLCVTFGRLRFEVETHPDLCLAQLDATLLDLSRRNHEDCDCLVVVFMTHGLKGKLRARDEIFDIDLLWRYFTAELCPSLAGKPKLFFVQSCQGSEMQKGVRIRVPVKSEEFEESTKGVGLVPSYVLPNQSDFLIALSTIPGCVSWRNRDEGSWYIQTLCEQLDRHAFTKHLLHILTDVARIVALKYSYLDLLSPPEDAIKKQLPSFISLLIKLVKFKRENVKIQKRKLDDDTQVSEDGESSTEREVEAKRTKTMK